MPNAMSAVSFVIFGSYAAESTPRATQISVDSDSDRQLPYPFGGAGEIDITEGVGARDEVD